MVSGDSAEFLTAETRRRGGQLVGERVEGGVYLAEKVKGERVGWIEDEVEELERWDGMS
jgi:hypothetical protein